MFLVTCIMDYIWSLWPSASLFLASTSQDPWRDLLGDWTTKWISGVVDWVKLTYMDAAIHEIQKVTNTVPFGVPHNVTRDTCFWGYLLPMVGLPFIADTLLYLSPPGSRSSTLICLIASTFTPGHSCVSSSWFNPQRPGKYVCSPDAFYPQHFLDEQGCFRTREAFVSCFYSRFLWSNFPKRNVPELFPNQWHVFGVQVSMAS